VFPRVRFLQPGPDDISYMEEALLQAEAALIHGDVPVGAVAVLGGEIISAAHNERELRQDPTAHAEMLVLRAASEVLGSWRLVDVDLYVTLEPCPMCAGAVVAARIKRLIYGAPDERAGSAYSLYNIVQDPRLNHSVELSVGVLAERSTALLQRFFQERRTNPPV